MLFISFQFLLFFILYFILHCLIPARYRILLIIVGSSIFYSVWNPAFFWVPHGLMLIAFIGALWFEDASSPKARKQRFILTLCLLFMPLVLFKYANFFFYTILHLLAHPLPLPLPLGISFITFTMTAYVIDVYRQTFPAERQPGMLSGLVLFFPHLIAGPILRPQELIPQFRENIKPFSAPLRLGFAIFSIGLLKKLVFADPLGSAVDALYATQHSLSLLEHWLALYGFSAQIYCDFSGYTDMAIGLAMMLGVMLPTNFNSPYTADSLVNFWHRWHITLSTWLRDYIYISLGGNRAGFGRQLINIMITMLLGGLWHGANWTFLIWGGLHGAGICIVHALERLRARRSEPSPRLLPRWLAIFLTFNFVTLAWAFFRAPHLSSALGMLSGAILAPIGDGSTFLALYRFPVMLIGGFLLLHPFDNQNNLRHCFNRMPNYLFYPLLILIWLLAVTISTGSSAKFLYFDF